MNKLSLMESCQQVVMINLSAIESHVKENLRKLIQNSHGETISISICPIFQNTRFSKQFWVVDAPFERSSPSRLQFSQNIFQRFTAPSGHVIIQDSP